MNKRLSANSKSSNPSRIRYGAVWKWLHPTAISSQNDIDNYRKFVNHILNLIIITNDTQIRTYYVLNSIGTGAGVGAELKLFHSLILRF